MLRAVVDPNRVPAHHMAQLVCQHALHLFGAVGGFLADRMAPKHPRVLAWLPALGMLIAIPLFTFAGYLFAEAQTPRRLVRLTRAARAPPPPPCHCRRP
mgnify:CR=1 FL=1